MYYVEAERNTGTLAECGGTFGGSYEDIYEALDAASNAATWERGADTVYVADDSATIIHTFTSREDAEDAYRAAIGRA